MKDKCTHCGSGRLVPYIDERVAKSPAGGNPFRERCLNCWKNGTAISRADFEGHESPHVLPFDADPKADNNLVALENSDFDYQAYSGTQLRSDQVAAADGGREKESENRFDCPNCGCEHTGYPEECDECGAPYSWENRS